MNTTQKESKNISPERADAFVRNVMLVLFLCRDGRPTCLWLWMRRHAGRRVRSNTFEFKWIHFEEIILMFFVEFGNSSVSM